MLKRVLSVVVLLPIFAFTMWKGGYWYLGACMLICGLTAWEFARIYDDHGKNCVPIIYLIVSVEVMLLARWIWGLDAGHRALTVCIMGALLWGIIACDKHLGNPAMSFAIECTGMVYIGWLGGYMISLRVADNGLTKLCMAFAFTWMADIGAYLVGRAIGKHHMFPAISPNKTWEGYFGGILFSVLSAVVAVQFIPAVAALVNMKQCILMALALAAFSPIGDFGESMIKRSFGVKDSSHLIPGHGGFFDRFDTTFFAMPLAYYFFELVELGLI